MLTGHLDYVGADRITGWARDDGDEQRRLILELYDGEERIARFVADRMRTDLAKAGLGDGRYGFWLQLPVSLFPMPVHRISVRFAETGLEIGGSPKLLYRPAPALDEAFTRWIDERVEATVAAAQRPEQLEPLLGLATNLLARVMTAIDGFDGLNRSTALGEVELSSLPERLARSVEQLAHDLKPVHVPIHAAPRVTVVIASSGRLGEDYALVRSIVETSKGCAFEIVLVDNSGAVETTLLPLLIRGGARVVRVAKPAGSDEGPLAAFAEGARIARAEILMFAAGLRGMAPGTVATLLETLEREGPGNLVAPRLIDADGRLSSCGLSLDALGTKTAIGQGANSALMRLKILREADDVALNALMVRRDLFIRHGGFSAAGTLGDYAVSDLCFALRAAGGRVLVQGAADAVLSGALLGASASARGRARFLARWNEAMPAVGGLGRDEPRVALVIDEHFPAPDEDAGSAAILSHVRAFMRLGYHVEFLATQRTKAAAGLAQALRARGIEAHDDVDNVDQFLKARRHQFDVIYAHRYHVAQHVLASARSANPGARILFSLADLHHIRAERARDLAENETDELALRAMRAEELACIEAADVTITHSAWEQAYLKTHAPAARVAVVLWDVAGAEAGAVFDKREGLCFLGSFRHAPNADAVDHFCRTVWPAMGPSVRRGGFEVVGSHSNLLKPAPTGPDIRLIGYVKDIAAYLGGKRLMVAPLRFGAGIKGKVLLALAHGLPCVMSQVAAEGIPLTKDLTRILVAENDADLGAKLTALHDDRSLWEETSLAALDWARATLSIEATAEALAAALTLAPERGSANRPAQTGQLKRA